MTFIEKYHSTKIWHERVLIMRLFHVAACQRDRTWTIGKTAMAFSCSIGLVSENLKLADAIDIHEKILACKTRQDALDKLRRI